MRAKASEISKNVQQSIPLKIYRGRFDPVVDLEREMFVARADQRLSHRRGALTDRQRFPIFAFRLRHEAIELIPAFENGLETASAIRAAKRRPHKEKKNQKNNLQPTHIAHN